MTLVALRGGPGVGFRAGFLMLELKLDAAQPRSLQGKAKRVRQYLRCCVGRPGNVTDTARECYTNYVKSLLHAGGGNATCKGFEWMNLC